MTQLLRVAGWASIALALLAGLGWVLVILGQGSGGGMLVMALAVAGAAVVSVSGLGLAMIVMAEHCDQARQYQARMLSDIQGRQRAARRAAQP
jgi:hypothetical protein